MKKLIPIMVVVTFLIMAGYSFIMNFGTDMGINPTDGINDLYALPVAEPTDIEIMEPVPVESEPERNNLPISSGTRFKVTTNTAISLDKPKMYQNYSYEDMVEVSGHLFEDNNSNGILDPGEDIPVQLGHLTVEFGGEIMTIETDEDGLFTWAQQNLNTVKGERDLKVYYSGQYTINGSVWYDVDTTSNGRLEFNDDNDYYIDVGYFWNTSAAPPAWEYVFPGNGYFNPGILNESLSRYEFGDVIIRDNGNMPGTWDNNGDVVVTNPLNHAEYSFSDTITNYYQTPGTQGRVDFTGPLVDEELPNTYDQSLLFWTDQDGDWQIGPHDLGMDGQSNTQDPGEGDGRPTPGEPYVDEDINYTKFRQPSNVTVWVSLWHDTVIDAKVINSTGKTVSSVTDSIPNKKKIVGPADVGEKITIQGTLHNKINPNIKAVNKVLRIRIFGNMMPELIRTNEKGEFNYTYQIPTHSSVRVGQRDIDIIFNDPLYDPDYNPGNESHEFLKPTSLSAQNSGPLTLKIFRPTHIKFEKSEIVGYLFKSITINGTMLDDNNKALSTTILHDDGSSEVITTSAYHLLFEWGRQIDPYYDLRPQDILDASGNFTIPNYEINDQYQETGEIQVTVSIIANESLTYYRSSSEKFTVIVRSKATIQVWIDQDMDGYQNERPENKKGPLADYITRKEFVDADGNTWDFNKVIVYGRLTYQERPDTGITGKVIKYYWEDEHSSYEESGFTVETKATHDLNLNGKIDTEEYGLFIIPDPEVIWDLPKRIQQSHSLGPIKLHLKFEDESDYIDPTEHSIEFDIVAMTRIIIDSGNGIKGENVTISGRLVDDLGDGVPYQNIKLYWEDLPGELLVDDKFDIVKLNEHKIGNVTTDANGYFSFHSEDILKRDIEVGQGYILAIFEGSEPPYTPENAYISSVSKEMVFNVSANTKIELNQNSMNLQMIRGRDFKLEGIVFEMFQGDKNTDSKVLLKMEDVDQMEVYIRNVEQKTEIKITDITVGYKSEGGFTITGTVPFNLDVGTAELRLVFKGSKDGKYYGDEDTSYHEIWADTYIKILAPDVVKKEGEEEEAGYFLREDLHQEKYDQGSADFEGTGLIFRFQLLEVTEGGDAKPIEGGRVELNINASYSVFRNFTIKYSDQEGIVNFTFLQPLTDTDWGYKLSSKAPEELEIQVEFSGKEYYLESSTLPIETTHWPPPKDPDKGFYEEWGWLIWIIVVIVIVFLIVFFFVMQWYTKQMRIRGMRRIIKRAADQLIAGNEYTAVIFKSYQKLGVHLRKYGYLRRESETFREFEDAVRRALPIDRMSMDKFLILLEEARYSSHQIGENQRNDAILNLRAIERSLDRIIIDESAAIRALERLETEGVKETKIIVDKKPGAPTPENVPQLLKKGGPTRSKTLPEAETIKKPGTTPK